MRGREEDKPDREGDRQAKSTGRQAMRGRKISHKGEGDKPDKEGDKPRETYKA